MRSLWILLLLASPGLAETGYQSTEGLRRAGLESAIRSFEEQDLGTAEELLLVVSQERPEDAEAAYYLGRVLLARGRAKEAVEEIERAARLDPASSLYRFWLAEALVERIEEVPFFLKLGVAHRMRAAYEKAVELDSENLEARVAVARYHSQAPPIAGGNPARATAELDAIRRRDPALAHVAQGLIDEQLGRPEPAAEEFRAAVEVDPQSVLAWREAGLFYQRRERWDDALRAFEEALACDPADRVALYEAARSAVAVSERLLERAERALQTYLGLEAGPEPVLLSDAEPPWPAAAHHQLGLVYERLGRSELAAEEYEAAVRLRLGSAQDR